MELDVQFRMEAHKSFAEFWLDLRDGELIPPRSKLDPSAIKKLLPHIMLFELSSPTELRVRLVGTAIVDRCREDASRQTLAIPEDAEDQTIFQRNIVTVLSQPCGYRLITNEKYANGRSAYVEDVGFPLADRSGEFKFIVTLSRAYTKSYSHLFDMNNVIEQDYIEHQFIDIGAGLPNPIYPQEVEDHRREGAQDNLIRHSFGNLLKGARAA